MPARFVNITIKEMDAFLRAKGFVPINLPRAIEAVYAKRVNRDGLALSLRVYTGINPDGNSRARGKDAIRVQVFWRKPNTDAPENAPEQERFSIVSIGGSRRAHRVAGWKDNLTERIDHWEECLGPQCPRCHKPMMERKGPRGSFWGCSDYPTCRGTRNIETPVESEAS